MFGLGSDTKYNKALTVTSSEANAGLELQNNNNKVLKWVDINIMLLEQLKMLCHSLHL